MSPVAATVIAGLAVAVVVLGLVLVVVVQAQVRERSQWAGERRALVDRALARHSGEIISLDRAANGSPKREPSEPILPVGLT